MSLNCFRHKLEIQIKVIFANFSVRLILDERCSWEMNYSYEKTIIEFILLNLKYYILKL